MLPSVVPQMNTVMLDGVDLSRGWALRGERGGIVPPIGKIPDNSRASRFGVGGFHSFFQSIENKPRTPTDCQ